MTEGELIADCLQSVTLPCFESLYDDQRGNWKWQQPRERQHIKVDEDGEAFWKEAGRWVDL